MNDPGLSILGFGCVTAHGRDWKTIWSRIQEGKSPERTAMQGPSCPEAVGVYKTPLPEIPAGIAPRLRRSGSISYFACAAAADAMESSGSIPGGRMALVYAASDGAVTYTRRFYEDVVAHGTGSPLLFPETVYNAPASHIAAMLGLDGVVLTLVNDATAGMDALSTASDLIHSGEVDRCLVVAAEELDWITCEGYRRWNLASTAAPRDRGAVLTEGAVAMVLGVPDVARPQILRIHAGRILPRHSNRRQNIRRVLAGLAGGEAPGVAVLSSSCSDPIEELTVRECFPEARILTPKRSAGEAFAASSLLQCLCACGAMGPSGRAVVSVLGWSGQFGGALLSTGPG